MPDRDTTPDEGTPHREGKMLTNDLYHGAASGQGACGGRETPARVGHSSGVDGLHCGVVSGVDSLAFHPYLFKKTGTTMSLSLSAPKQG